MALILTDGKGTAEKIGRFSPTASAPTPATAERVVDPLLPGRGDLCEPTAGRSTRNEEIDR
ncbi:hypothetical protein ASG06_03810 [Rathayibacter sp. Leaf185]|nr:hypothetical protein ASF42_03800 [Rathayibacter sp. Leaf294]KQS13556.1 hypothetical protein ASG06_03810 [Rathayibacter sp. Leaf185]